MNRSGFYLVMCTLCVATFGLSVYNDDPSWPFFGLAAFYWVIAQGGDAA